MAHYGIFVQDSSPLFIYSPAGAWIDTPSQLDDSPSSSYHATNAKGAMVKLDFVGTGVRVFSATVPTPGSYEVYVDGQNLSDPMDSSSQSDSQLLLGSVTGLEMGPHTVTLVNSGAAGGVLDLARMEVDSVLVDGSSPFSTVTFDDTADGIQWGPGWVSALGRSTLYNSTSHYTEESDAKMSFSFEGDAIAIYGTSGTKVGYYTVTLDGLSETLNGGSDGSVRTYHDKTILYLANGLGAGRHQLTITANPSSLGAPQVFNVDCVRILSGGSSNEPALFSPGLPTSGTSSSLPSHVPTGLSYTSVISSTVFSTPTPFPTSTSSTLPPSIMSTSSPTPPNPLPATQFNSSQPPHVLQVASSASSFQVLTDKLVTSSAIVSGIIAGVGLIFFALFILTRKNLDPPSYIDLEKAGRLDKKGRMIEPGERSPELPIQPAEKTSPKEKGDPFADSVPYARYQPPGSSVEQKRGHSRNESNASSITLNEAAYDAYWESLHKRARLTGSVVSIDGTYRDSVLDHDPKDPVRADQQGRGKSFGSISSVDSEASRYSQTSERILINDVRMPPQFSTPTRPTSAASPPPSRRVSPPRPPRVRESLALPF